MGFAAGRWSFITRRWPLAARRWLVAGGRSRWPADAAGEVLEGAEFLLGRGRRDVVGLGREQDADGMAAAVVEVGVLEVVRGGLESVEEETGALVVEGVVGNGADDLHEGALDGVGVLEDGEVAQAGAGGVEATTDSVVEVAEDLAAQGGRAALNAVGLEVLATGNDRLGHGCPLSPWSLRIRDLEVAFFGKSWWRETYRHNLENE